MEFPCSSPTSVIFYFELHISFLPSFCFHGTVPGFYTGSAWKWWKRKNKRKREGEKEGGRSNIKINSFSSFHFRSEKVFPTLRKAYWKKISKFMNMQLLLSRQITFLPKCSKMHSFSEYITFIILCGTLNENFPDLATEHIFIFHSLTQSPG